ncbi:MAG: PQQ-binding-like beta-propeller repeat protein [Verrucomicrobia bacterium]|nr:PQQ-binding-like beta-propeller repeat protein [Verrucomicrobiota bacterium]
MKQLILAFALVLIIDFGVMGESDWPQFRGPNGSAIGEKSDPPIRFGPSSNVVWKIEIASGNSSPCLWSNRIFLTTFDKSKLETLCIDRQKGQILWRQKAPVAKFETTHPLGNPATPTPATDGKIVYVYFGSFGLLAYDCDGKEQWRKPLKTPEVEWGAGSSPIVEGDLLILNCDQDLGAYLLAVDKRTGKTIWMTERPEFRRGFATPFVWRHGETEELVLPGSLWLKSYDLKNGKELWTVAGTSRVACSSPTAGDDLLFSASWNIGADAGDRFTMPPFDDYVAQYDKNKDGKFTKVELPAGPVGDRFSQIDVNHDGKVTREEWQGMADMFAKAGNALLAIRPGGHGDITKTHIAWKVTRSLPYVSSPLYYDGKLYTMKNGGLASCYDAKNGKPFYQDERVGAPGDYYSSAVAAKGRIYLVSQQGIVLVMAAGETLNVLARNNLESQVMATPAIADGKIYVRTADHFYAFGK